MLRFNQESGQKHRSATLCLQYTVQVFWSAAYPRRRQSGQEFAKLSRHLFDRLNLDRHGSRVGTMTRA